MATFRQQLEEHLLDLAWRQWSEIGVAGVQRGYGRAAIAPEELILLTSTLAAADPRLRDESIDWCVHHGHYVSNPRLKNLLKASSAATREAFARFAATVNALSRARWPGIEGGEPWRVKPSGKSRLPSLQKATMLHLRLRAFVGVSARADVIAAFLSAPNPSFSAADLIDTGYTKRNIAQTLDSLAGAGLLRRTKVRNLIRFQWAKREQIEALLKPLPDRIPSWPPIVRLMTGFRELAVRLDDKSETICTVEVAMLFRKHEKDMEQLSLRPPDLVNAPAKSWTNFQAWALAQAKLLAQGKSKMLIAAG